MKKGLIVLVVDDNRSFANRMVEMLEELENVSFISIAANYDEGYRSFVAQHPDVVLLDINMPGKNGIELLKKIKQGELDCKVLIITNHADEYYRQQCNVLGAEYFLDKTNDFSRVPEIISGNLWSNN